ncbi:ASKHA domain-containing protein [Chloroflexota bacterium]
MNTDNFKKQKIKDKEKPVRLRPIKKRMSKYVWLNVQPMDVLLKVRQGDTVRKALRDADIKLEGDCGGLGKCGKCRVKILSPLEPPSEAEIELLDEDELGRGIRLACRINMDSDLVISIDEVSSEPEYYQILATSHVITERYIPTSELEPLVSKKLITLSPDIQNKGIPDLDRIRSALDSEYSLLKASIGCLRNLPQRLAETQFHGTAVVHENCLIDWQRWEETHRNYGLAFDIGTSTLVGKLINLVDGSEMAVASCLNSQSKYGSDVISRLLYAKENTRGLQVLQFLVIEDLNQLIEHLLKTADITAQDIYVALAAGNTTMQHFLLGLSPLGIAEAPFSPVLTDPLVLKAVDVGLHVHPESLFYVMPAKSGYIGGDMIGVLLTSGAAEQDDLILGLDLGTNGEIFLGNNERVLTCSAAAGPALEGGRISHGMIAKTGAIEGVRLENNQIHYQVIGNIQPKGICGSGLVDLVAALLHCGIIDYEGWIGPNEAQSYRELNSRVEKQSGSNSFLIASPEESNDGEPIYLTQKDVREVQLAKGAIAAGINTLMDEMGITVSDISRVYLAGALGNYVSPLSTVRTGMIFGVKPDIISSLGNAASMGASMALLSRKHWEMARDLAHFIEHIELSSHSDFNQYFIEHIDFPMENIW